MSATTRSLLLPVLIGYAIKQPSRYFRYPQTQWGAFVPLGYHSTARTFLRPSTDASAQAWTAKLDKSVRFYQTTDLGVLIAGTEKSLYAIDAQTGDTRWRRKTLMVWVE